MRGAPLAALMAFSLMVGTAFALVSFNSPNFAWDAANVTGAFYLKSPCTFQAFSTTGTGGLTDFNTFTWTPTGATWPRLGFSQDTPGAYMNITSVTKTSITFVASASTVRIWSPDAGAPIKCDMGVLVYDNVWAVSTITVPIPGPVTVSWSVIAASIDLSVFYAAFALMGVGVIVLGVVVVLSALSGEASLESMIGLVILMLTFIVTLVIGVYVVNVVSTIF